MSNNVHRVNVAVRLVEKHCGLENFHSGSRNSSVQNLANSWMVRNMRPLCTSRLIGEPLTLEALKGNLGAAHVIHPKPFAGVLAEIKLGGIAVQVFGADVLVNSDHPALPPGTGWKDSDSPKIGAEYTISGFTISPDGVPTCFFRELHRGPSALRQFGRDVGYGLWRFRPVALKGIEIFRQIASDVTVGKKASLERDAIEKQSAGNDITLTNEVK